MDPAPARAACDGRIHVFGRALGDGRELFSGGRIGGIEYLARGRLLPGAIYEMSEAPVVPVEPAQRLARILRRRAVIHGHKFFDDAHSFRPGSRSAESSDSGDRMTIVCRVPSRCMVLKLPFDIRQHATDANAEQVRMEPRMTEFLLHQRQPFERLLRRPDAARRFEADCHAGLLRIFADRTGHHQANGKRGIDGFLAG